MTSEDLLYLHQPLLQVLRPMILQLYKSLLHRMWTSEDFLNFTRLPKISYDAILILL